MRLAAQRLQIWPSDLQRPPNCRVLFLRVDRGTEQALRMSGASRVGRAVSRGERESSSVGIPDRVLTVLNGFPGSPPRSADSLKVSRIWIQLEEESLSGMDRCQTLEALQVHGAF